jgi:hydroxymethylglutaryl-CoA lyase
MSPFHTPRIPQTQATSGRDVPFSAGLPVTLVECPRDAMQGWPDPIPTADKIRYLEALLKVGFDTLDFGSFVSAAMIPQMADTREVISRMDIADSRTRLLAIVANFRGAEEACDHEAIGLLGFPFSVSETFQLRNINKTIDGSLATIEEIQELCIQKDKKLVVYLSMGFGNPYGDPWSEEIVLRWAEAVAQRGVRTLSIADTVGLASPEQVFSVTDWLVRQLPDCAIGVHLHSTHKNWKAKLDAALQAGCKRFDGALKGIGGCPMAGDALVGNMDTELMIPYFREKGLLPELNGEALREALRIAGEIFK